MPQYLLNCYHVKPLRYCYTYTNTNGIVCKHHLNPSKDGLLQNKHVPKKRKKNTYMHCKIGPFVTPCNSC